MKEGRRFTMNERMWVLTEMRSYRFVTLKATITTLIHFASNCAGTYLNTETSLGV